MGTTVGNRKAWATALGSLVVAGFGVALIVMLPRLVGVSWAAIGASLGSVPVLVLAGLTALWLLGLLVHLPVLMAAMPGLTARQALTLNLSGSAVSNVLPLGGPAGMGLGFAMARGWGFKPDRFASFTLSTNLCNSVGKLVVGSTVLAVAAPSGVGLPGGLGRVLGSAAAFVAVAVLAVLTTFRSERATSAVGRRLDGCLQRACPGAVRGACKTYLLGARTELVRAVGAGWRRMGAGVLCYLLLQAALLYACLAAVGAGAPISVVMIAFAVERLISLAPITPGASGLAELGTVAALNAYGVNPVVAAAGVLIYRILMFAIEIPVGGALILGWLRGAGRPDRPLHADEAAEPAVLGDVAA